MQYKEFTEYLGGNRVRQIDSLSEAERIYGRIVKENEEDGRTFAFNGDRWVRAGLIGEDLETISVTLSDGTEIAIARQFHPEYTHDKPNHDTWKVWYYGYSAWGYLPGSLQDQLPEILAIVSPKICQKNAEMAALRKNTERLEREAQNESKADATRCYKLAHEIYQAINESNDFSMYKSSSDRMTGKLVQRGQEWLVVGSHIGTEYQDEDGITHQEYPADSDVEILYTSYVYETRPATLQEIEAHLARVQAKRDEAGQILHQANLQRLQEREKNRQERYDRRMQFIAFLTGKLSPAEVMESGYDLPAVLYSHDDSPVKKHHNGHPVPGVESRTYGNGLGYVAPAAWVEEIFQFAIAHDPDFTEQQVLDWLKSYGPTVWREGREPAYEEYSDYKPSGCAGSEFYEWAAMRHYNHSYPVLLA